MGWLSPVGHPLHLPEHPRATTTPRLGSLWCPEYDLGGKRTTGKGCEPAPCHLDPIAHAVIYN